jgi:DNA-binding NtrC family response regulator
MLKVLIVDHSNRDAQRFQKLLAKEGADVEICLSGEAAKRAIDFSTQGFSAAVILWDLVGPISGADLILKCRQLWSDMPVVVTSDALDASMATRAYAFGAREFLAKPLDSERIISCLRSLFAAQDPLSPLVDELRERIVGQSRVLTATLKELAKVIPHGDSRVLLIGESGTGKELLARALHDLGPRNEAPWVAINIAGLPPSLIESGLFGYEKGAFTGANERHVGIFEEAGSGTVFLDEIGELDLSVQSTLLRVIQEKAFRRLNGKQDLAFNGRLVCATNRDLAQAVNQHSFRADLFHRIAEVTIQIPPLRDRNGDIDLLLDHFLDRYRTNDHIRFARESLDILRSYPFSGNVRELENIVSSALIQAEGAHLILPRHLPLTNMAGLLASRSNDRPSSGNSDGGEVVPSWGRTEEIAQTDFPAMDYSKARELHEQEFDRIHLPRFLERARHNVTRAASAAGIDAKTFRRRWEACNLPSLKRKGEDDAE